MTRKSALKEDLTAIQLIEKAQKTSTGEFNLVGRLQQAIKDVFLKELGKLPEIAQAAIESGCWEIYDQLIKNLSDKAGLIPVAGKELQKIVLELDKHYRNNATK